MKENWKRMISLTSHGARYQVKIAIALLVIIPLLVVYFVCMAIFMPGEQYSLASGILISILGFALALTGYSILRRYPINIVKLRQYLRSIVAGELPGRVALVNAEEDCRAIEKYLNMLLIELRKRIQLQEEQLAQIRANEQQLKAVNEQLKAKEQALLETQVELKKKISDLERFNRLTVGRELEMVKLKKEVDTLLEELGRPKKYK